MRFIQKRVIKNCKGLVYGENINRLVRGLCENMGLRSQMSFEIFRLSQKRWRSGSIARIKYRCIFSNSASSVNRFLRCSRHLIWKGGLTGVIPGLRGKLW
jgi:hypothetical protein